MITNKLYSCLKKIGWESKFSIYDQSIESISINTIVKNPLASVIVVSNKPNILSLENFIILNKQRDLKFQLIFVDNGSKCEFAHDMSALSDISIQLKNDTGAYFSRNVGACFADAPSLIFLDDDGIPTSNFIQSHVKELQNLNALTVRGVVAPRTDCKYNNLARHYYLGPKPFPRYPDLEGNMSIRSSAFFYIKGWDDNIKFGHGGVDLSFRLFKKFPDMKLQMYSPLPIIYHDYAKNDTHLSNKYKFQSLAKEYLRHKHKNFDSYILSWDKLSNQLMS